MFDFLAGFVMGERTAARSATFARAAGAASGAQTTEELYDVNARIDRLLLVVDAMWSLLKESGYTDEALAARISAIDEADGITDGKRTPQARRCGKCDAMVEPTRTTCAFCGTETGSGPGVLDSV
jgi:hypothetical protein